MDLGCNKALIFETSLPDIPSLIDFMFLFAVMSFIFLKIFDQMNILAFLIPSKRFRRSYKVKSNLLKIQSLCESQVNLLLVCIRTFEMFSIMYIK